MIRKLIVRGLLALLLLPVLARAADVQATLDRNSVQLGETVTLELHVDGDANRFSAPDLSALAADFEVLGSSQSNSLSIFNGTARSSLVYGIELRPRHTGLLQIPALAVDGGHTAPLQLQVSAADPAVAAAEHKDVFMEAQVEPDHGYVGQQLSYVVRLYYGPDISGNSLDVPQVDGIEVDQIGDDLHYDAERDGRSYHVVERRYALVPQKPGHAEMPPLTFRGAVLDPSDPTGFFGGSTPVSASTPARAFDVRPAPADWGSSAWLPARQLTLSMDGWPQAQQSARVGQPLNLTMNLQATGLSYEVLPALSLPALDGATVYPDKPVTGNRHDDRWLVGWRQQRFAIVPERAGTLEIPAITVKWWNVLEDRAEVAQIPAHRVTVLPAVGNGSGQSPAANADHASAPAAALAPAAAPRITPWRWIAIGSLGLWLASLLAWWGWRRWRRRPVRIRRAARTNPAASIHRLHQAFLDAARRGDTATQAHALLAWARAERPSIQHLGQLAAALGDSRQRAAVEALQQRHYAGGTPAFDGAALAETFRRGFVWQAAAGNNDDNPDLPPLYPFKLH